MRHKYIWDFAASNPSRAGAGLAGQGGSHFDRCLGYVPVTFLGLKSHADFELLVDGKPFNQAVHGNDSGKLIMMSPARVARDYNILRDGHGQCGWTS